MEVTELTAEAFWKGETEIRGTVMDGEDEYRVRILRKGSQNFDYSCSHISKTGRNLGFCGVSCTQGPDGIPMCPHAHALLAEWLRRESRESKHPVSTSQKVRFMVREYTNREVSRIMGHICHRPGYADVVLFPVFRIASVVLGTSMDSRNIRKSQCLYHLI